MSLKIMKVAALDESTHSITDGNSEVSKSPLEEDAPSPSRRKRLCVASVCLVFTGLALIGSGVAFSLRGKSKATPVSVQTNNNATDVGGSVRATPAPTTTSAERLEIQRMIAAEFGDDYLDDPTSIQHQALEWLMNHDRYQIDPNADNLIQRFVMASFYLQTSQEGEWKSCNPPQGHLNDVCYHYYLIDGLSDPWRYRELIWTRWLSGQHECEWAGVTCHSDKVTGISLNGYNLAGNLPTELAKLDNLTKISLTHNELNGLIPTEIGEMKNLTDIELENNAFGGSIPNEFFHAERLFHVNLASNNLSGGIPEEISLLSNLGLLFLQDNNLSGSTSNIASVDSLEWLFLGNNRFSGTLPSQLGGLKNMFFFYADGNPLTGTIPTELGLLTAMREVDLHDTNIGGSIPDEIYLGMNQNLNMLDLSHNNLSGSLSTHIGRLNTIDWLLLHNNHITGTIPTELALVTSLRRLELQSNDLSGTVPADLCYFDLGTLKADCSGLSATVACPCCTECCDQETGVCVPE